MANELYDNSLGDTAGGGVDTDVDSVFGGSDDFDTSGFGDFDTSGFGDFDTSDNDSGWDTDGWKTSEENTEEVEESTSESDDSMYDSEDEDEIDSDDLFDDEDAETVEDNNETVEGVEESSESNAEPDLSTVSNYTGNPNAMTVADNIANSLAFSCPVKITMQKIPVDQLIVSHFKKRSRETSIIGLTSIIEKWGIVQPLSVLKLVDDNQYLVLDGLRRLFAAIKSGIKEVECRVWDFEDKTVGKKMANVLSLMITRAEKYTAQEQWNMLQILEDVNDLDPGMIEYLTQMNSGEAMKLKDIMTCNDFYADEIKEKLLTGEFTIEQAYKKLANERKKENKLAKEDSTSVDVEGLSANDSDETKIVDDASEQSGNEEPVEHFSNGEVAEMLELAKTGVDDTDVPLESLNKTEEIRGSDMHQKVGERHPVDPAVRQGTFIRDGFKCRCCGLGGNEAYLSVLAFHHAVPVYLGGPDTKENGLTLCVTCHILLHNYLFGQLQVELDKLDEHEQQRFRNVFKYGNIALEAQKRRGMSKEDAKKQDTGLKHPMPNANVGINKKILKAAEAEGYVLGAVAEESKIEEVEATVEVDEMVEVDEEVETETVVETVVETETETETDDVSVDDLDFGDD